VPKQVQHPPSRRATPGEKNGVGPHSIPEWFQKAGLRGLIGLIVAAVIGFATFTEALDGLLVRIVDRCRVIGICDPLPPAELVGTLTEVRVRAANAPQIAAWTERNLATPEGLAPEDASWPGQLITYRVEFQGLEDSVCRVQWTLINADTGERVIDDRYGWVTVHANAYPDSSWAVEATSQDANIGVLWVPNIATGRFMVEVELLDPDGIYLDIERTPPFTVAERDLPTHTVALSERDNSLTAILLSA
jgi:hypothetical protein